MNLNAYIVSFTNGHVPNNIAGATSTEAYSSVVVARGPEDAVNQARFLVELRYPYGRTSSNDRLAGNLICRSCVAIEGASF